MVTTYISWKIQKLYTIPTLKIIYYKTFMEIKGFSTAYSYKGKILLLSIFYLDEEEYDQHCKG
jgi:hypothetical protein